jgi:hypothetical protein
MKIEERVVDLREIIVRMCAKANDTELKLRNEEILNKSLLEHKGMLESQIKSVG